MSIRGAAGVWILVLSAVVLPRPLIALEPGGEWVLVPGPPIAYSIRGLEGLGDVLLLRDSDEFQGGYGILWVYNGEIWGQIGSPSSQAPKRVPAAHFVHAVTRFGDLFAVAKEMSWDMNGEFYKEARVQFGGIGSWVSLPSYPTTAGYNSEPNRVMTRLTADGDVLYAAGWGELNAWSFDGTWQALGEGFGTAALAGAIFDGHFVVLAKFSEGEAIDHRVGWWDGTAWETLGEPFAAKPGPLLRGDALRDVPEQLGSQHLSVCRSTAYQR